MRSVLRARILAATAVATLVAAPFTAATVAAQAAPATSAATTATTAATALTSRAPAEPTPVWSEDFEHNQADVPTLLRDYSSSDNVTYTSDPYWAEEIHCNGVILNYDSKRDTVLGPVHVETGNNYGTGDFPALMCGDYGTETPPTFHSLPYPQLNVARMADVLGQVGARVPGGTKADPVIGSTGATRHNHALTEWTLGGAAPTGDELIFRSGVLPISLPAVKHYYTTSVDVAEVSCEYKGGINNSKLAFYIVSGTERWAVGTDPIQACTDPRMSYYSSPMPQNLPQTQENWGNAGTYVGAGRYYSNGALLLSPAQMSNLQVELLNRTLVGDGNDFAVDNIQFHDATPTLYKDFAVASIPQGAVTDLTFTVTNTTDLASKLGWSFSDTLRPDLLVAADPNVRTTCLAADGSAGSQAAVTASGSTIAVTGGIGSGTASCTVTVAVTSAVVGTYPNGPGDVTVDGLYPPNTTTLEVTPVTALSILKTASIDSYTPGSPITYTVTARNAASTAAAPISTATGAVVRDEIPASVTGATWTCQPSSGATCAPGSGSILNDTVTIPAGGSVVYTITGTVAAGTTGQLANTATVTPPPSVTDPACTPNCGSTTTTPGSGITIVKTASTATISAAGETITYTFDVTNTGQSNLRDVFVSDVFTAAGTGVMGPITCVTLAAPAATCSGATTPLVPGQTATFTGVYTTSQADVDTTGALENTATATGTPPSGPNVTATDDESVTPTATPAIEIVKTADLTELTHAGQVVTYTFVATNRGNQTLTDVAVSDVFTTGGAGQFSAIECVSLDAPAATCSGTTTTLAPAQVATFSATYVATQADLDGAGVANTATVTGTPPSGVPVTDDDDEDVPSTPTPAIAVIKAADRTTIAAAGEDVAYTFTVTNTGNQTLTNVFVTDVFTSGGLGDMTPIECVELLTPAGSCSGGSTSLAPGQDAVFTAVYTTVLGDIDVNTLANTATATGTPPTGAPVTASDDAIITPQHEPGLTVVKTADRAKVSAAGDKVVYTFTVTNSGNQTLRNITVADTFVTGGTGKLTPVECAELQSPAGTCSGASVTLIAGQVALFQAVYTVSKEDLAGVKLVNSAVVTGTTPDGPKEVSPPTKITIIVTPPPAGPPVVEPPAPPVVEPPAPPVVEPPVAAPPVPGLPLTGGSVPTLALGAVVLLIIGGCTLLLIRRRSTLS